MIQANFEDAGPFSEDKAPVKITGLWGFIDKKGQFVISPRYDSVSVFRSGVALVREKGKREVVDSGGRILSSN